MSPGLRFAGRERGVGLIEVMIGIVISMLLVLVIYQIYEVSEGQKRTITAGSDAHQNASYGLFVLGRELAMAGNGIASLGETLDTCAAVSPVPVLIQPGANDSAPDTITVLYGGSSSLSTPVPFRGSATTGEQYVVAGPVGFSANDVIAATKLPPSTTCTLSKVTAVSGLPNPNGEATLTQTPFPGSPAASYGAGDFVVNLGQLAAMGRIEYTVDTTGNVLRTQNRLPTDGPVNPLINDVVNLKAQYGIDANCDGVLAWQDATGTWSSANVPTLKWGTSCVAGVPSLRQIRAVRVAIVTRSPQYEKEAVTPGPLLMLDDSVSMTLSPDDQHYRYKVLESSVPLRNALWNGS